MVSAKAGQSAVTGRVSCTKGKLMLVLCVAAGRAFCSPAQNTYALAVIDCTPQSASFNKTLTYSCSASRACYHVAEGANHPVLHTACVMVAEGANHET